MWKTQCEQIQKHCYRSWYQNVLTPHNKKTYWTQFQKKTNSEKFVLRKLSKALFLKVTFINNPEKYSKLATHLLKVLESPKFGNIINMQDPTRHLHKQYIQK